MKFFMSWIGLGQLAALAVLPIPLLFLQKIAKIGLQNPTKSGTLRHFDFFKLEGHEQ